MPHVPHPRMQWQRGRCASPAIRASRAASCSAARAMPSAASIEVTAAFAASRARRAAAFETSAASRSCSSLSLGAHRPRREQAALQLEAISHCLPQRPGSHSHVPASEQVP